MSNKDYIIFDFETGGRNPNTCQPTQLAAIALDGRSLKVKGTFNSEIRAIVNDEEALKLGLAPVEEGALKVTGKKREDIDKAPSLEVVWTKFVDFVNKYNWNKNTFSAPIPCGYNIINYDMIIINRLCKQFNTYYDEDRGQQKLFNQIFKVDLMDTMFLWTEGDPNIKSISMDSIRTRMGMSKAGAHDALQDVKDTANIFIKFVNTHRKVYQKLEISGAFNESEIHVE
jgi:DNA polymerase III epsilon subunit-like protein